MSVTLLRAILGIVLVVVSATPGCPAAVVRAAAHAIAAASSTVTESAEWSEACVPEDAACCALCGRATVDSAEDDLSMAASASAPAADPCDCVGCAARDLLPTMTSIATVFDLHVALPTPLATLLGVGLHDGCWLGGMRAQLACLLAATRGEVEHPALGNGRDVLRWHCALVV